MASGTSAAAVTKRDLAKVRYDGSACINVRSVTSICKLLAAKGSAAEPLTWAELSSVLWFVETVVTSNNLFFDGTVPQGTAAQALEAVEQLKQGHELKSFQVSPIVAASVKDVLQDARDAMAESRPLIEHFTFDLNVDRPLDQNEHENFFARLDQARSLPATSREARAEEWVSDGSRGGKCLAALIENGDDMLAAARGLYDQHPGQASLVSAALINRFRLNYVNHLAAKKRSAYVPDRAFETVTKEHIRLFKDYVLEEMLEPKAGPGDANIIVENMQSKNRLPPIGLYALMATKAVKQPAAILETAYNEFRQDSGLMKLIWSNTKGGIALRKGRSADEYVPKIEQYFYDHYKALAKEADGINILKSGINPARTYFIPSIKGLVKVISAALALSHPVFGVIGPLLETAADVSIPLLCDKLFNANCNSYISQYQSWNWNFQNDPAVKVPLARLAEHAARVFGRPVADPPN